jgi:hypothetical protein
MLFSLNEVMGINVDNVTTNGLRGIQSQSQIFMLGIDCVGLLVDGSFINGVRTRMIDHFAGK